MIVAFILLIVYLLSTYGAWKFIQIDHSKGGRYEGDVPELILISLALCPVANTAICIEWILWYLFIGMYRNKNVEKFFKIKK